MNISQEVVELNKPFKKGDIVVITDVLAEKDKPLIGRYYKVKTVMLPGSSKKCNDKCGEMCIKSDKENCVLIEDICNPTETAWICYVQIMHKDVYERRKK